LPYTGQCDVIERGRYAAVHTHVKYAITTISVTSTGIGKVQIDPVRPARGDGKLVANCGVAAGRLAAHTVHVCRSRALNRPTQIISSEAEKFGVITLIVRGAIGP